MSEIRRRGRANLQGIPEQMGMRPEDRIVPGIPGEAPEEELRAVRSGDAEEAYQLGMRMGAQSIAQEAEGAGGAPVQVPGMSRMTKERVEKAQRLLMEYKAGKASVERRIINAQQWWKLKNWEQIENKKGTRGASEKKSSTAWLWNCIVGKHADAMDSFPEPVILPRMQEDKAEAKILSDVIPVIMSMNGFEDTYSDAMWQKMQEGTGAYHIGWDKTKLGGIGDISIRNISLLNLYWEPGVEDLQESANVFYVQVVDTEMLEQQYPELKGRIKSSYLKPAEYRRDDSVKPDGKSVLVDWYYHVWQGNRKILHYCQFVNDIVLYSTENNGDVNGLYDDGEYPFVLDALYPVHGSPAGYGYIDIAEDTQADIDTINQAMVRNAVVTSTPRYFIQSDGAINEDEFADWSKPFVHSGGGLGDNSLRPVQTSGIQGNAMQFQQSKIEELKFITGNQDVQNGGTPSGVTAASAIAALQEMSGRASKDSTRSAYRAFNQIVTMVIERIRQFYEIPRMFRILGANGQEYFVQYSNANLQDQQMMGGIGLEAGFRHPVFDIDVRSQRENAYTKITQNELAIQFYNMGVFNPQMTDQVLLMLDMMDFKGKEEIANKVRSMGTLQDAFMKVGQIAMALAERYDPAAAAQLAPVMQQIGMEAGMMQQPAGGENPEELLKKSAQIAEGPDAENALVRKSRERAANASRPDM